MSYQVLARKWRPRDFASLVGQEHVVRALRHALEEQRLHHAYLFTGTRGVGKTTLARILAKCLNCEQGVTAQPCGQCSACTEIDAGRFVDLLEVDAATNTRVDEMRQLLDTAQYAPTRARYKVYVIDEVHMLSTSAFNAMLKTLEEPPAHLKFILATTDPQKIPVTVLSRCLQFNLKQMPPAAITAHLAKLLQAEGIEFETEALAPIGRAAAGSMRDALSLLDQAIAHGAGRVSAESVQDMLGAIDRGVLLALLEAVAEENGAEVMRIADEMQLRSLSFDTALADLAGLLLQVTLAQTVPAALEDDLPERARIETLAGQVDPEIVQLDYQILLQGRADLPLAPDEYAGFVMTLLRMIAFRMEGAGATGGSGAAPAGGASRARKPAKTEAAAQRRATPAAAPAAAPSGDDWAALVGQLAVTGAARELARHAALKRSDGRTYELTVPKSKASLAERSYQDKLKAALEAHLGRDVVLKVNVGEANSTSLAARESQARDARQADATRSVEQDRFVQSLVELFDGKVVESTIRSASDNGK
ncbi:MAG: DNA polymerase III subunit gamma/tau [Betaproteobacteria bacterium SG8_39]|nr:MAG: DNA polymerase III subunit gamma/tau [Betaproteobacteria bacterium SG8_39]